MGIFGKRSNRGQPIQVEPEPIEMNEMVLVDVAAALEGVERAMGTTNDHVYLALRALAETGGAEEPEKLMAKGRSAEVDRPWRWLAAAASYAEAGGNDLLTPRILQLSLWWEAMWLGALGQAKRERAPVHMRMYFDTLLDRVPRDVRAAIAEPALRSLQRLPCGHIVAPLASDEVVAGTLLDACARELLTLRAEDVAISDSAFAAAQQLVGPGA